MKQYVIYDNHINEVLKTFGTLDEANDKLEFYTESWHSPNEKPTIHTIDKIEYESRHADDGSPSMSPNALVSVTAEIDGGKADASFYVQMCNGVYMPQNGCWITTGNGDFEFDKYEEILFLSARVVRHAEDYAQKLIEENLVFHDLADENHGRLYYIAENKYAKTFHLAAVNDNFTGHDYNVKAAYYGEFYSIEELNEAVEDYDKHYRDQYSLSEYMRLNSLFYMGK